jgi:hypothetical protein
MRCIAPGFEREIYLLIAAASNDLRLHTEKKISLAELSF